MTISEITSYPNWIVPSLLAVVIYFLKRLVRKVENAVEQVALIAHEIKVHDKSFEQIFMAQKDYSDKMHRIELEVAILNREFNKKRDNKGRHNTQIT